MASADVARSKQQRMKQMAKKETQSAPSVLREDCFRIMEEDGRVIRAKAPKLDKNLALKMYRSMSFVRLFDERGMMLQRQGRIGFYVPSFGQEAIQIGTAAALEAKDWVFPSYREPGIFLYRGASPEKMLCNLFGNSGDVCQGRQMPVHYSFADLKLFSVSSPIATQVIQAVGAAMASKTLKKGEVAITYFGDGATSENDFHTGMTFAGSFQAPAIMVCTNNQYAISVPLRKQTACKRLVDKAVGYGMPGVAVDGNDVLAVYEQTRLAVERARKGEGPSFLECVTFRMGPHSSSDDPTRYRDEKLYEAWKKRDPIIRFRTYLADNGLWNDQKEKALQEELKEILAKAVESAEKQPPPGLDSLFDGVYAELTPQLKRQREALLTEGELRGRFENTSEAFPL